jgi:putative flippase GtrA
MRDKDESRLRSILRRHFKRVALSILVAIPVIVFGAWLLRFEVSQHHIHRQVAPVINWPLITLLAFASNLLLPWKDRGAEKWEALRKWTLMSLGHSLVSYTAYTLLVQVAGWQYLFVSIGLTAVLSPISYVLRNVWIFVAVRRVPVAEAARVRTQ